MALAPGHLLNERYEILAMLGQGGMGAVYRAQDMTLGRAVALKERTPDPNGSAQGMAQARAQFRREAQTLAQASHPNLPHIYDFFSVGDSEYIVMDLVEGENLHRLVQERGAQPEAVVLNWTRQILDALIYLHAHNIIHRDIKPHNLILTPDDRIVLVDFGLVKLFDPGQPSTLTLLRGVGTPEYAPLEQYSREVGHTDPRTDIYALGATLYTLLAGKPPSDVHVRLLHPDAWRSVRDINPNVSFGAEAIIEKAMGLYPQQRYQTANDMLQAFGFSPSRFMDAPKVEPVPLHAVAAPPSPPPPPASEPELEPVAEVGPQSDKPEPVAVQEPDDDFEISRLKQTPTGLLAARGIVRPPQPKPVELVTEPTQILPPKRKLAVSIVRGILRMQLGLGTFVEFVRVPAGNFLLGSDPRADRHAQPDELPQNQVTLAEYWISKYPITVAQFTIFTDATNRPVPFDFPQKSSHPIVNTSWFDALVFCRWASDVTGKEVRLPTEAEWEKAARGTDGRIYPWGNDFDAHRLNSAEAKISGTTPVDGFAAGASPYGAWDMAGNVWEWVNDWYKPDYYAERVSENPQGPETGYYKALRGGAWFSDQDHVRAADRTHFNPENRYDYVGFRVVVVPDKSA
ncbi:MAG: SUMF1/EgtB/PvdO family nonheme iron enzyme [Chloroflexi bacterium]|nr:SUMF1/EgtB/PvdO family nonheme iron enzyme [Chloroflexota bacterium]